MSLPVAIATRLVCRSEGGADIIERTYSGTCSRKGPRLMLFYEEQENAGTVRLLLTPERARLFRRGQTTSEMAFAAGRTHASDYATPHGAMEMLVETSRYALAETPGGGEASIDYAVWLSGCLVSRNTLLVRWTFLN